MSGQMMLSIAAMVLLSLFIMNANSLILQSKINSYGSEYSLSAIEIGQSIIEEAKTKAFDEKTLTGTVSTPDSLTGNGLLGTDTGESFTLPDVSSTGAYLSMTKFDDVDDYNSYTRTVNTPRAKDFKIKVDVKYVVLTDPNSSSASRTYCKRMVVSVTHPSVLRKIDPPVLDTIRLYYAFTY